MILQLKEFDFILKRTVHAAACETYPAVCNQLAIDTQAITDISSSQARLIIFFGKSFGMLGDVSKVPAIRERKNVMPGAAKRRNGRTGK
jgi:hypothetical protein